MLEWKEGDPWSGEGNLQGDDRRPARGRSRSSRSRAGRASSRTSESITGLVERVLREERRGRTKRRANPKAFNYLVGQVLRLEPKADAKLVAKTIARRKIKR